MIEQMFRERAGGGRASEKRKMKVRGGGPGGERGGGQGTSSTLGMTMHGAECFSVAGIMLRQDAVPGTAPIGHSKSSAKHALPPHCSACQVSEARARIEESESEKMLSSELVAREAVRAAEQDG
jgi:hypothetical protein